jgi:hypothetical protein
VIGNQFAADWLLRVMIAEAWQTRAHNPRTLCERRMTMKNCNTLEKQMTPRILLIAGASALALALTVGLPQQARADRVTPPAVPDKIQVPAGATPFLVGHALGTQNYICLPLGSGFKFVLFTPQATLFGDNEKQIITHYFSPNPDEGGTIRATWQDSHDTSTVWAFVEQQATNASDPHFVKAGAVAWLRLAVVGSQSGPIGSNKLAPTTFIQRVNTSGGLAPSTGCDSSADVGHEEFVPYTADYFFYTGGN